MLRHFKISQFTLAMIFAWSSHAHAKNQSNQDFSLNITDVQALNVLNESGLSFRDQMSDQSNNVTEMIKIPLYSSLLKIVDEDLVEQELRDNKSFPDFPTRVDRFKTDWLRSKNLTFSLVAVVNRFDRRGLSSSPCGETRLIYRPGYPLIFKEKARQEHLPMTVSLIYSHSSSGRSNSRCRDIASKMAIPNRISGGNLAQHFLAEKSLGYPIAKGKKRFDRLEFNIQISRWPTIHDESFSDQSHYLLRRLSPNEARSDFVIEKLENTPDVTLLTENAALYDDFKKWILSQQDNGIFALDKIQVPERFLASKVISVSPFGLSRLSNLPFSRIFLGEDGFDEKDLRKLDSITCTGCHQSQSVAGFHVLGGHAINIGLPLTLSHPFSSYFDGIQGWRKQDLLAYRKSQPSPEFPVPERIGGGQSGDSCDLAQSPQPWLCSSGFYCDAKFTTDSKSKIGECVTANPELVGKACDASFIASSEDPLNDRYVKGRTELCGDDTVCAPSRAGFPGGFCTGFCKGGWPNVCVRVPNLGPFSSCVTATKLYRDCAAIHSIEVDMPACETNRDCRRDYACVYVSDEKRFCAPPYFLPDLTLEHHEL